MRLVAQRVLEASVSVHEETVAHIGPGLLLYLGIEKGDSQDDLIWMAEKILKLRIFPDQNERMQFPITEVAGSILLVSQFTLCANLYDGNRPSFTDAMHPDEASIMVEAFRDYLKSKGIPVQTGVFGAHMQVHSINDGPVTFTLQSPK